MRSRSTLYHLTLGTLVVLFAGVAGQISRVELESTRVSGDRTPYRSCDRSRREARPAGAMARCAARPSTARCGLPI